MNLIENWSDEGLEFEIFRLKNAYNQSVMCVFNGSVCERVEIAENDIYNDAVTMRNCRSIASIEKLINLLND